MKSPLKSFFSFNSFNSFNYWIYLGIFFVVQLLIPSISDALHLPTIEVTPLKNNPNIALGITMAKKTISEIIISRKQYVLSWNKDKRVINWAAWKLDSSDLGHTPRPRHFLLDKELSRFLDSTSINAVDPSEYNNSCFDRGHQVPSGDRKNSKDDDKTTFYMSNIIPQTAYLNRGAWEHLEEWEREQIRNGKKRLYIVVGTIFDKDYGSIGPNKDIVVPAKNYKIIVTTEADSGKILATSAVIMPNITSNGEPPTDRHTLCEESGVDNKKLFLNEGDNDQNKSDDWKKYLVDISQVEKISGFKFFTPLY
ncbi:MAG: DNA/RNA non-specific endonuclease [Oligoflexia bacterium]|nr:DNA/RNA non-specific endonuclease [Oligoflexia bacterium]